MADLFGGLGGLGGLVKGLSGLMPQDDPEVQLMTASTDVSDLKNQETTILVEIGRRAFATNPGAYPAEGERLRLIQANLAQAEEKVAALQKAKAEAQAAQEAADAAQRCPACGFRNPDGVKFCQECGSKLGAPAKQFCVSCGAELEAGTRFCGTCGARQGE